MGDKTEIEWADATWNPTRGCSRLSAGCQNCYAEKVAARFSGPGQPYEGVAERRNGKAHWTGQVKFIPSMLKKPLLWKQPRSIFVDSMSDLFHEAVETHWIDQVMAIMALAPRHTFMILTRRAERMHDYFSSHMVEYFGNADMPARVRHQLLTPDPASPLHAITDSEALIAAAQAISNGPLPNLWLGVSVEDQPTALARLSHLVRTPAAHRFVSYEPALARVDLAPWLPGLDAIIFGGESGSNVRAANPVDARFTRDQCATAGVHFYFKQWGAWLPVRRVSNDDGNDAAGWVADDGGPVGRFGKFIKRPVRAFHGRDFVNVGKKAAGALLDGRTHQDRPWQPTPLPAEIAA